jgi:Xaa-Pro aminopeptidase
LPAALRVARWSLGAAEVDRYRALGRDAATAMSEVLRAARPEWTGHQLAGASAEALWGRGIHPALVLVGDARRLPLYRHPTPAAEPIGERVMVVFCARRHGLYANLTRSLYFRPRSAEERRIGEIVAEVEADALDASRPGASLGEVFAAIVAGYARAGEAGAEAGHHQGGPCGYLSREAIARPDDPQTLARDCAVAWNPSLPGAKIEDTVLVRADGLEILTTDPSWPTVQVRGRARPTALER